MKSVNVITVNGKTFFLDGHDSFMDMMEFIGLPQEDVVDYAMTEEVREEVAFARENMCRDGVYGDSFYVLVEEMQNYLDAFKVAENRLRAPSRKGNTRADIADYINLTCSNYETIIP